MAGDRYEPITVLRWIGAPASEIFQILADPVRHRDLDGSGMLYQPRRGGGRAGLADLLHSRSQDL